MKEKAIGHVFGSVIPGISVALSLADVEAWLRIAVLVGGLISIGFSIVWKWRHRKD